MSTFKAQILIGQKHSYDGGILNITHSLYLSENDRPAWLLTPTDLFSEHLEHGQNIIWIPTVEKMLEDALVMVGLYVLKDKELIALANQYFRKPKENYIELYQDIKPENLQQFYRRARQIEGSHKLIFSVFHGSTILEQLSILNHYEIDIEVCTSVFSKEFSLWSKRFETKGELK